MRGATHKNNIKKGVVKQHRRDLELPHDPLRVHAYNKTRDTCLACNGGTRTVENCMDFAWVSSSWLRSFCGNVDHITGMVKPLTRERARARPRTCGCAEVLFEKKLNGIHIFSSNVPGDYDLR